MAYFYQFYQLQYKKQLQIKWFYFLEFQLDLEYLLNVERLILFS